jgi:hypothetical protein
MSDLTLDEFRSAYPGFTAETFPDSAVSARLTIAAKLLSPQVWPDEGLRKHVQGLYTAHYLTAQGSAAAGGSGGGAASGIVASKSVDGASVSYDTGTASETGAGFWNLTPYGRELWKLMRVFGAGAIQL